ncbi:UNVERIFIED_CONTAM: Polynucleotide 3'-phosphatase ZDP [Sesamum calycinum]|uniref:Polynucleotide 3'-phosphatase ZDP n=1 Tax=Sesamum calycinum TaxID=2727403 RepID=A0AAW2MD63_9LAMI
MLNFSNRFGTIPSLRNPSILGSIKLVVNLSFNRRTLTLLAMSSTKIVAEYAKSGRSSCKKCSKAIASSSLRLGLVSKDPRGFDMTKWHHLECFPFNNSDSVSSAEAIAGFSSLKSIDQESVKKLVNEVAQDSEKVSDGKKYTAEGSTKKDSTGMKVYKTDEKGSNDTDQGNMKKRKLVASEEGGNLELEIAISASDIKDKYKDAVLLPKWKAFQTIIFLERDDGLHDSKKIAAFDFDGCLAKTSVKRVGADAWSLMYPSIPEKLQSLYNDGYKLVIFTNESNIERWKNKRQAAVDSKIGRLENFIKLVKVPIQVFIACGLSSGKPEDPFRKPKPGMWRIMEKEFNSGLEVDMDQSFYVGDAAGRPDDHSDADIKFAQLYSVLGLMLHLGSKSGNQVLSLLMLLLLVLVTEGSYSWNVLFNNLFSSHGYLLLHNNYSVACAYQIDLADDKCLLWLTGDCRLLE